MDGTFRVFSGISLIVLSFLLSSCGRGEVNNLSSSFPIEDAPPPDLNLPDDKAEDTSQAVGFYAKGSIISAVYLPFESPAHLKIFRLRHRSWGTKTLINTIVTAAASFRKQFPFGDRVQIGDMSSRDGGPLARHSSHQNGLDADVAYLQMNFVERNPDVYGNAGFAESFVVGGKVTTNFDIKRNWYLLKEVVLQKNVGRIFVDPKIKQTFCELNKVIDPKADLVIRTAVLRRLRPYPNHADHFHMRIDCPLRDGRCQAQEEPPAGSGCSSIGMVSFDEHEL